MAAWKLAPAIVAGNCVVLKPASEAPVSILILTELISDILPPDVFNIVNGNGREVGFPLATSKRIAKIAFTGSTSTGRVIAQVSDDLKGGCYVQLTLLKGHNKMRVFQEDIFGPVLAVTTFKDEVDALAIAIYGLGAGVWTRDGNTDYRMGRAIEAGRVDQLYHAYPAHAAFGGYKKSGIGRETHKMMLDHYQRTKNLLVSYSEQKLGFF